MDQAVHNKMVSFIWGQREFGRVCMNVRLFISSVQKELAEERAALRDYLRGAALLRRFFEVFLFEEIPAARSACRRLLSR